MCALHRAEPKIHNEKEESLIDPKSDLSLGVLKNKVDGICSPRLSVAEITCATSLVRNLAQRPHVFCAEAFYFCGFQTHTGLNSEEDVFTFHTTYFTVFYGCGAKTTREPFKRSYVSVYNHSLII